MSQTDYDASPVCRWIFDSDSFGVLTADRSLTITNVNFWFERSSRKEREKFPGKLILDCFPEIAERNMDHYLHETLNGASSVLSQQFHNYLFQFPSTVENDPGFMQQSVRISPLVNSDEEITGLIVLVEDVTQRVRREERLRKINEELTVMNATKDKFFNIVAHDLRSPFNALIGLSQILQDNKELKPEEFHKIVSTLHSAIKNQYAFLENLLQWARLKIGQIEIHPENVTLGELTDEVLRITSPSAETKQIKITRSTPGKLTLKADKQTVVTILYNLVFNAIKFTTTGGSIELGALPAGTQLTIFVRDSGIGISEERVAKLFRIDSSFSTPGTNKEKGSGLGLILCKDLVEKIGGRIWVESIPGQGSTFYIRIPGLTVNETA